MQQVMEERKSGNSRTRKKLPAGLASFPQYVNKVQSKMKELRRGSLLEDNAMVTAGHHQALSAKHISSVSGRGKRRRAKRNSLSSCLDSQWSPPSASNKNQRNNVVTPRKSAALLPRLLTPLNHTTVNRGSDETLHIRSATHDKEHEQSSARSIKRHLQETKTHETDSWTTRLHPHRLPAPPSQCVSALPAPKSPLLTIPRQKPLGWSNSSLSTSTGSSTTSSNVSTPIPSSPVSFLVASKTSLSSNDLSPPTKPRHSHLPPLSVANSNSRLSAGHPGVHITSSLPQLRSVTPARKTPTHSLGRSPARSPVCGAAYIMPVTKLNPLTRPTNRGANSLSGRRSDSVRTIKTPNIEIDVAGDNRDHGDKVRSSANCLGHEEAPSSAGIMVSVMDDTVGGPPAHNDVTGYHGDGGKGLMNIPMITIRSATPIKTPSEEDADSAINALLFDNNH